jgi:hypothetical protein
MTISPKTLTKLYWLLTCAGVAQFGLLTYWFIDTPLLRDLDKTFSVKYSKNDKATEIALKHFPIGSSLDSALESMKESGFKIVNISYTIPDKNWRLSDTKESYIAVKAGYGFAFPYSTKTLKIIIDAENGKIIFLRALAYYDGF